MAPHPWSTGWIVAAVAGAFIFMLVVMGATMRVAFEQQNSQVQDGAVTSTSAN